MAGRQRSERLGEVEAHKTAGIRNPSTTRAKAASGHRRRITVAMGRAQLKPAGHHFLRRELEVKNVPLMRSRWSWKPFSNMQHSPRIWIHEFLKEFLPIPRPGPRLGPIQQAQCSQVWKN